MCILQFVHMAETREAPMERCGGGEGVKLYRVGSQNILSWLIIPPPP